MSTLSESVAGTNNVSVTTVCALENRGLVEAIGNDPQLTAKLKIHVHPIAHLLTEATYRRGAYLAHTKMTYVTDEDHYDPAEDEPIGTVDRHGQRRNKRRA